MLSRIRTCIRRCHRRDECAKAKPLVGHHDLPRAPYAKVSIDIKYDECERIINGYGDEHGYHDERVLPIIYELDKRERVDGPESLHGCKANPGLGTIKSLDQLKQKVIKAKADSLLVKNLVTKDFNVRETVGGAWLTFEEANNTATFFDIEALKAAVRDRRGGPVTKRGFNGGESAVHGAGRRACVFSIGMYWIPEDLLEITVEGR